MFRRKEENANDLTHPAAQAGQDAHNDTPHSETAAAASHAPSAYNPAPSASTAQPVAAAPYVPTSSITRTAAPSAHEPARTNTGSAAAAPPSYRPTPIAEFNRGAMRTPSEPMRGASPAASVNSFGNTSDKASAPAKSNRRVLTVGNDILLKGEIATCDRLVIEGRVEAKLSEVHTVEIAECGSFKGTAEVEDAEISGVFEGDLVVRNRLVIYATGEVRGNISYGEIEIERGGRLTGQIKTVAAAGKGKISFEADKAKAPFSKETAAA